MSKDQIKQALEVVLLFGRAIYEAKEIPAGHLYARVMGTMSSAQFNAAIDVLVKQKLVERKPSHLLVWIGGEL